MNNFMNMKIEINKDQPLHLVVKELERLGYYLSNHFDLKTTIASVVTDIHGGIVDVNKTDVGNYTKGELTTLSELKEM